MRDNLPNMLKAAAKEWREKNKVVATGATRYDAALEEAADAIEELITLKALADAKIERLESTKIKKKRPPKRLPCTCGRKRLELWWSSNPSDKGWFLKCPNCGRQSQPERYKSHVNSAWNDGLPTPPKEE